MSQLAVIKTGGKQYLVKPGTKLRVEKLIADDGAALEFDALLTANDNEISIGNPAVKGITVTAKVLGQGRDKKKIVFRYHAKTRYRKMKGHRQPFTEIEITKIGK